MSDISRIPVAVSDSAPARPTPGDFGAEMSPQAVQLPAELREVIRRGGVRSVEDLIDFLDTFPTEVAAALKGWTVEDVRTARNTLLAALGANQARVSAHAPPRRSFGAQPPAGRRSGG